ncbi:transposase, partial [Desulfobacterota bacterium AH_259_B03_O07]|nr:transposase [Desulfobacterota bacterium AH_259_B03_O07]
MKAQFAYYSPNKVLPNKDIRVEFTGKNLTKFGGMSLIRKFLRHLKVKEELENALQMEKRERKFQIGGMLLSLLYAITLELKGQSDTLMLRLDKVFQKIAGLDDYPTQSTISRFLKGFRVETAKGIAHVNQKILKSARRNFEG